MSSKMDPILSAISVRQLALVEDQLSNNEVSSDEEMHAFFVENGLSEAQATQALTYRDRYRLNIYMQGSTPILAGDDAYRFNPHIVLYERERDMRKPPPKRDRKRKR